MTYPYEDSTLNQGEGIPPVSVRVVEMPEEKERDRHTYRQTFRTVVLTSTQSIQSILDAPDPSRCQYYIIANDAPVVISASLSDAQSPGNTTVGLANPVGALLPQNMPCGPFDGQSEVWASCPLAGASVNRITVISSHRVKM